MYKMSEKIYLTLLILCGILFQAIIGTFAEEIIMESSNLLMRNKRQLLSKYPHAVMRMSIQQIPYVVQILRDGVYTCTGNVISYKVILTAAHCVEQQVRYHILSGSEYAERGNRHEIDRVIFHPEYHSSGYANDLALLKINPGINIERSPNRLIKMHNGFVPPRTDGIVSSWGCVGTGRNGEIYPDHLQSIATSVISEEKCRRIHRQHQSVPTITDRNICTLDEIEETRCGNGDSGAPLVISNELVGVMAWSGGYGTPDVFINLTHPAYRRWILQNIPSLPPYAESSHYVHNQYNIHHPRNP